MLQLESLREDGPATVVDPVWSYSPDGGLWLHLSGDVCGAFGKVIPGIGFNPFSSKTSDAYDEYLVYSGDVADAWGRRRGTGVVIGAIRIDWKETPECHVFKADLPGFKKEEVKVEVKDGGKTMEIRGERGREKEENNDMWHLMERGGRKFIRRFKLPEGAKLDMVNAAMEDGVLTVTVPKEEVNIPDLKSIAIFLGKRKID